MATKNNPGDFDCYAAAGPDEPIFILRANDVLAPSAVLYWAENYEWDMGRRIPARPLSDKERRKIDEARQCAGEMVRWFFNRYGGYTRRDKDETKRREAEEAAGAEDVGGGAALQMHWNDAQALGERFGFNQVIVYARSAGPDGDGREQVVTWGTKEGGCSEAAAVIGRAFRTQILKWDDDADMAAHTRRALAADALLDVVERLLRNPEDTPPFDEAHDAYEKATGRQWED